MAGKKISDKQREALAAGRDAWNKRRTRKNAKKKKDYQYHVKKRK